MRIILSALVIALSLSACKTLPPGHDPNGPGNSENAPGHQKKASGKTVDGPGNSENAPGQKKKQAY